MQFLQPRIHKQLLLLPPFRALLGRFCIVSRAYRCTRWGGSGKESLFHFVHHFHFWKLFLLNHRLAFFFFQISKDFALLSLHHSDDKSAVKTFFFLYVHHSSSFSCCFYYLSLFKQIVDGMILVFVLVFKFVNILQFMSYNFHHIWKTFTYFFKYFSIPS